MLSYGELTWLQKYSIQYPLTTYSCLNIHLNLSDVAQLKPDCQHVYALKEYIVPDVNEDVLFYACIYVFLPQDASLNRQFYISFLFD